MVKIDLIRTEISTRTKPIARLKLRYTIRILDKLFFMVISNYKISKYKPAIGILMNSKNIAVRCSL